MDPVNHRSPTSEFQHYASLQHNVSCTITAHRNPIGQGLSRKVGHHRSSFKGRKTGPAKQSQGHGPPKSFKIAVCRWFNGICCVHELLEQFATLYRSKMENFAKNDFAIVTSHNGEICYVKHVLDPLCVFFTLFGCWGGGAPKGFGAQPAYAVLQPRQLKNGNFRNCFFFLIFWPSKVIKYPM